MTRSNRNPIAWAWLVVAAVPCCAAAAEPAPPATCFWDPRVAAAVRQQVARHDPAVAAAMATLHTNAEKALRAGPFSVVDKQLVPPSGDLHDFSSVGRYYWPNPDTKDGLPWVTIDGKPNPDIDNGKIGDEPRLVALWQATRALSRAAYLSGDRRYAVHAADLLRAWFITPATRMNPTVRFAARYPGHWDGRYLGIHTTARPVMDILDAVELLRTTDAWRPQDQAAMVDWCGQYLSWLTDSDMGREEAGQKNNHSTSYDCLVVRLALFTGNADLAKQVLTDARTRRIARQVQPDGSQPLELARATPWEYSRYNLEFLGRLAMLGDRAGVDLWQYRSSDGRGIRGALDYLVARAADPAVAKRVGVDRLGAIMQIAADVYHDPTYLQQMRRLGWRGEMQLEEAGLNGVLGSPAR